MTQSKQLSFCIFDHPCVRRVSAWVILHNGGPCGKMIVAYPSDGAGIVKAQINLWAGPLNLGEAMKGKADGFGYDKTSAAVADALNRAGFDDASFAGRGDSAMAGYFESKGYTLVSAI